MAFDRKEKHFIIYDWLLREQCDEGRDLAKETAKGRKFKKEMLNTIFS